MSVLTYDHLMELTNPKDISDTYFAGLLGRNREKYGSYVRWIKYLMPIIMRYPCMLSWGHQILPLMYAACRIVDDVIDGDLGYQWNVATYIKERLSFLEQIASWNEIKPETPEDRVFAQMFDIAERAGSKSKILKWTNDIIRSMSFDAERIQAYRDSWSLVFPDHKELEKYFNELDVNGTWLCMAELLRLEWVPNIYFHLNNVWSACRIEYNLTDLIEDLQQGIVNIPSSDAHRYGITVQDLLDVRSLPAIKDIEPKNPSLILYQNTIKYPPSIRNWILDQVQKYHVTMGNLDSSAIKSFPIRWRLFLKYAYTKPSDKAISKITNQFPTHA